MTSLAKQALHAHTSMSDVKLILRFVRYNCDATQSDCRVRSLLHYLSSLDGSWQTCTGLTGQTYFSSGQREREGKYFWSLLIAFRAMHVGRVCFLHVLPHTILLFGAAMHGGYRLTIL